MVVTLQKNGIQDEKKQNNKNGECYKDKKLRNFLSPEGSDLHQPTSAVIWGPVMHRLNNKDAISVIH